jgi:hypothetical protein
MIARDACGFSAWPFGAKEKWALDAGTELTVARYRGPSCLQVRESGASRS